MEKTTNIPLKPLNKGCLAHRIVGMLTLGFLLSCLTVLGQGTRVEDPQTKLMEVGKRKVLNHSALKKTGEVDRDSVLDWLRAPSLSLNNKLLEFGQLNVKNWDASTAKSAAGKSENSRLPASREEEGLIRLSLASSKNRLGLSFGEMKNLKNQYVIAQWPGEPAHWFEVQREYDLRQPTSIKESRNGNK